MRSRVLIILIVLLLLPAMALAQRPSRMAQLNDTLYLDMIEVTVADWLEFMYISEYDGDSTILTPDQDALQGVPFRHFFTLPLEPRVKKLSGSSYFGKISIPLPKDSLRTRDQRRRAKTYMVSPIVGIDHSQTKAYCEWRFNTLKDLIGEDKKYDMVRMELPSPEIYSTYMTVRDSSNEYCARFNFRDAGCLLKISRRRGTALFPEGVGLVHAQAYMPDDRSIYNLQGNAAEMTSVEGIAKGGSYLQYASECTPDRVQEYDGPQPWLGFRCMAVVQSPVIMNDTSAP